MKSDHILPLIEIAPDKMDTQMLHNFLNHSYWANGRTLEEVQITIQRSDNFGLFLNKRQIG